MVSETEAQSKLILIINAKDSKKKTFKNLFGGVDEKDQRRNEDHCFECMGQYLISDILIL